MNKKLVWILVIVFGVILFLVLFWFRFSILLALNPTVTVVDGSDVNSFPGEMLPTKGGSEGIIAADTTIAPYYTDPAPGFFPQISSDGMKFLKYSGELNYPNNNVMLVFNYDEILNEFELPKRVERAESNGIIRYYWMNYNWFGDQIYIALNEKDTMKKFLYILNSSNGEFKEIKREFPIFNHEFFPNHEKERFAISKCTSFGIKKCLRTAYYLYDGKALKKYLEIKSNDYTRIYGWDGDDFIIADVEVLEFYDSYYEDLDPNNIEIKKVYRLIA